MEWEASQMFEFGYCDDCGSRLTPGNTLRTRKSAIFKGGNIYILCDECKQIFLYNIQRKLLMSLDEYRNDEKVIAEINEFFEELGGEFEVLLEEPTEELEKDCSGDCDSCGQCCFYDEEELNDLLDNLDDILIDDFEIEENEEEIPFEKAEPVSEEIIPKFVAPDLSYKILALNTKTGETTILEVNELEQLEGSFIETNVFYELNPLVVEKVVSYKFSKRQ